MEVIENVVEVEYRIRKNQQGGIAIVTTYTDHIKDEMGKSYEIEDMLITVRPGHQMPVGFHIMPIGTIYMPVEPVSCVIRDKEGKKGKELVCDAKGWLK